MSNPTVAILMSTYNGEKYLTEQINSILKQSYKNIHLFIRDDGSVDGTISILQSFVNNPYITIFNGSKNLGYKNSFLTLIKSVVKCKNEFDYFSFADQDDVWERDKILSAVILLEKNKNHKFRLYYTGLTFVDENLNVLKVKDESRTLVTFGAEIVRHSISGATAVFSYNLGKMAVLYDDSFNIKDGHDSFVFRLNAAIGGVFLRDEVNYIKFRRHSANTSSATSGLTYKIKNELKRSNKSETETAFFLQKYFIDILNPKTANDISALLNYRTGIFNKYKLLTNKHFRRESWIMNMLFIYRVMFDKL